ncbi:MAG: hypothetical protein JSV52_14830 [Candidatus Zixiibacteriota bacterium]|nr:MAG: hypothetical protein JSV52_14830 [candidate division Zixibacteria bacterium]
MGNSPKMTIIGFGVMGKKYAGLFSKVLDVTVVSSRNVRIEVENMGASYCADLTTAIGQAGYILICAPLDALDGIISSINEHSHPECVVIDICSARVAAHEKLAALKRRHFGLHGNIITGEPDERMLEYLSQTGLYPTRMTPTEHDQLNSIIGLVHFVGLVLNKHFGSDDRKILAQSPAASHVLRLMDHLRSNSPATYKETQIDNGYTGRRRNDLIRAMAECDRKLNAGEFPFA